MSEATGAHAGASSTAGTGPKPDWASLPDEKLLDLRICNLHLAIEGSYLEPQLQRLFGELEARGLRFRPHVWLSDEWFTPDGVPGIAVPFYLAHPRLARLEENQMLEIEGGTPEWCMRILRHEAGHAIDNAYQLRRRAKRLQLFGYSSRSYPDYYLPRPYSKSYVLHLDSWYAQSHPDEDFAETFAVWITPDADWRTRYEGWPALRKLEYVDELMNEIAGQPPLVQTRRRVDPVSRIKRTLRTHYARKREHYGVTHPDFYDRDLRRLFSAAPEDGKSMTAARFIARHRKQVRRLVAAWTGEYQYTIDRVIEAMIHRCHELRLHLRRPEEDTRLDFLVLLTVQTLNYLHSGRHRVAL
jgi:hypothetical protein